MTLPGELIPATCARDHWKTERKERVFCVSENSAALEPSVKRPWFIYGVLLFGLFAIMLILGMITPVLPYISKDLNINSAYTAYVSVLYTLGAAVLSPMMGRLGDLFGMKRILTLGLLLFAGGCLCIGIAPSLPVVLAGRFLQGLGFACTTPTCMAFVGRFIPRAESGKAYSIFGAVCTGGCIFGPTIAGFICTTLGWRFVYYGGAVWVAIALIIVAVIMPNIPVVKQAHAKFDIVGSICLFIAVGSFLTMFTIASQMGWTSPVTLALIALFVVFIIAFILVEKKKESPLVNLNLFKMRSFGVSAVMYLVLAGFSTIYMYMASYYITGGLGLSATITGFWTMFLFIVQTLSATVISKLLAKYNWRTVAFIPVAALGIACILFGFCDGSTPVAVIFAISVILGFGGAFSTPLPTASAMLDVPDEIKGAASGTFRLVGDMGGSIYVAIFIPLLSIIGAKDGVPNFGYSFGKVSLLLLIPVAIAFVLALLYPKHDPKAGK